MSAGNVSIDDPSNAMISLFKNSAFPCFFFYAFPFLSKINSIACLRLQNSRSRQFLSIKFRLGDYKSF